MCFKADKIATKIVEVNFRKFRLHASKLDPTQASPSAITTLTTRRETRSCSTKGGTAVLAPKSDDTVASLHLSPTWKAKNSVEEQRGED